MPATYEQLMDALRAAHEAGNEDDAQRFADMLKVQREGVVSGASNVPVTFQTGDPETDRRIAENLYSQGHGRALTKSDALHAAAVAAGFGASFLPGGAPLTALSAGLMSGGASKEHPLASGAAAALTAGAAAKALPWAAGKVGSALETAAERNAVRATGAPESAVAALIRSGGVEAPRLAGKAMLEAPGVSLRASKLVPSLQAAVNDVSVGGPAEQGLADAFELAQRGAEARELGKLTGKTGIPLPVRLSEHGRLRLSMPSFPPAAAARVEHGAAQLFGGAGAEVAPVTIRPSAAVALVQHAEDTGGFTWNPRTGEQPSTGFAFSANPQNERIIEGKLTPEAISQYVQDVAPVIRGDPTAHIGAWKNEGKWHLDVSRVLQDPTLAEDAAKSAGQRAMYNLERGEEIPVLSKEEAALMRRRMSIGSEVSP